MMQPLEKRFQNLKITVLLSPAIALGLLASPAMAQIVPDATLPINSSVKVEGNVSTITGGTIAGKNLFHSFSQFSVPTNGTAYFNNAPEIQNILSRVTGNSVSDIDGLIKANDTANLFLINPNGIIFGRNASLNIGGSFIATTADAIQFDEQNSFSASNPNASPLLTVNPSALFFNRIERAAIQNNSQATTNANQTVGLQVREGRSLLLVGGKINLEGGQLTAEGGHVELAGIAGTGTVGLDSKGHTLKLALPNDLARTDVSLTKGAGITVAGSDGGSITINARSLNISGNSNLNAGIAAGKGTVNSQAGDITLNATKEINITQSQVANRVNKGIGNQKTFGNSGRINVNTGNLSLAKGGRLSASTFGQGRAGNVKIIANEIKMTDIESDISSNVHGEVNEQLENSAPRIEIETGTLSIKNGAQIRANTDGKGNAGNVKIIANAITMTDKNSIISSNIDRTGNSNPNKVNQTIQARTPRIDIQSRTLSLSNGAQIRANTDGNGNAGNVKIVADTVTIAGKSGDLAGIQSRVGRGRDSSAIGNAGTIEIQADSFTIEAGGQLSVSSFSQGDAGSVIINARKVTLDAKNASPDLAINGLISSTVQEHARAPHKDIKDRRVIHITATESLSIKGTAQIYADTLSDGDASNVIVDAGDVSLDGRIGDHPSGIFSRVFEKGTGQAGIIQINAKTLSITNGAGLFNVITGKSSSSATGVIQINASDRVVVDGQADNHTSGIFGNLGGKGAGKGASIDVHTGSLILSNGARLFSTTSGAGDAGNITVVSPNQITISNGAGIRVNNLSNKAAGDIALQTNLLTLSDRGFIQSDSASGQPAGKIDLDIGKLLLMRRNSQISTSAGTDKARGDGGNITIRTPLLAAIPNEDSNIIANAYVGTGGKITITTQGLFGFQQQSPNSPLSDISASSEFGLNGQVNINVLSVDPSQGLVNLPTVTVDTSRLITQQCSPSRASGAISQFVITGRGGLPAAPGEQLRSSSVLTPWVNLPTYATASAKPNSAGSDAKTKPDAIRQSSNSVPEKLIEAQGWVKDAQGNVALIAQVSSDASVPLSSVPCHGF